MNEFPSDVHFMFLHSFPASKFLKNILLDNRFFRHTLLVKTDMEVALVHLPANVTTGCLNNQKNPL